MSVKPDQGQLESGTIEGDYVAPDAYASTNAYERGGVGFELATVVIGDQAWLRDRSSDPWEPISTAALLAYGSADPSPFGSVLFLFDTEFAERFAALAGAEPRGVADVRAGIQTIRYEVPLELAAAVLPSGFLTGADSSVIQQFSAEVWVDPETSAVVAFDIRIVGTAGAFADVEDLGFPADARLLIPVESEASQLNDPAIAIEPPR